MPIGNFAIMLFVPLVFRVLFVGAEGDFKLGVFVSDVI